MSLRDQLDCSVDFVGMILICSKPLPNCFFKVCFPTLFAAVLKVLLPLITSPISGAANSKMSAPMHFATGTTYLRKKGVEVLPVTIARASNPIPSVFQQLYSMEFLLVLKQPSCSIVRVRNECQTPF